MREIHLEYFGSLVVALSILSSLIYIALGVLFYLLSKIENTEEFKSTEDILNYEKEHRTIFMPAFVAVPVGIAVSIAATLILTGAQSFFTTDGLLGDQLAEAQSAARANLTIGAFTAIGAMIFLAALLTPALKKSVTLKDALSTPQRLYLASKALRASDQSNREQRDIIISGVDTWKHKISFSAFDFGLKNSTKFTSKKITRGEMLNRTMSRILYRLNLPHKDLKFIAEEDSLIMTYIRIQKVPSVGFIIYNLTLLGMSVVYFVAYRQAYGLALLFIAFTLYSIKFLWTAAVVSAAKKYSVNKYFLNLCEKELSINGLHAKRAYSNSRLKIRREKFRR